MLFRGGGVGGGITGVRGSGVVVVVTPLCLVVGKGKLVGFWG